ncbi:MAG: chromosomal replication initiator protein DnaA [Candidatus Uhrbacteria bacterium GW2011_GWF2_41_16]|uniref:Chromosomal replication initiator protein DnaA n=2 Tax=Candidatus Uhriibacteriota TaxID=1752732 RepID=A0A0G0VDR5_9BACT|nr:MAG: chromosomal replication initiator protein DnaA [Candidatus Uhrbacteria bacterium GW2011_GWC2_41_11]KKR97801.1 MAG: chromosomal replication initiator protein DnaA [Candidatus Uhrbacteria bacterium GW2011_GWF2_41_16]
MRLLDPIPMNTNELWQAVLGELELKLSKANFTTWFKNTFILVYENQELVIGVPNTFTKAWLEKKYHRDITNLLQQFTSDRVRNVVYRVEIKTSPMNISISDYSQEISDQTVSDVSFQQPVFSQTFTLPSLPRSYSETPEPSLNQKYAFSNFIVGKQNELAHAAAQAVSMQPGGVYNPLFIYGGVGLGKTHLLQAVGNEIQKRDPQAKILYITCENFTNDFIHAVRTGRGKEFKDIYRNVDVLLIDDIQFITGKEGTQEEFFHTFNALHQNNKQIILSSDRPPKAIPALEQRLSSRFEWGMMTDIGSPDFETRIAILEAKCREKKYLLDGEILHHVATTIQSNVRELEGALNKIIAFHQFKNMIPTVESVKPILTSFQPTKMKKSVTTRQLIHTVALYYDLSIDDLLGKSREKRLAFPRQIIMFLMREEMKCSYPSIGNELGGRDHTTAMHAYDKITNQLTNDERLQHDIETILQRLYVV